MILRPRARPQSVLQAFVKPSQTQSTFRFQQRRSEHTVPDLGNNNEKGLRFQQDGVPGFLTPKTYRQAWQQYQQHLCDEVNSTIEGITKYASMKPQELHVTLSHNPEHASLYNQAAMLHFNHFFWDSLSSAKKPIPSALEKNIKEDFDTVEDLRVELLQHADAMFGNGFVWLMKEGSSMGMNKNPRLRILCTYNAGSPYTQAHQRRQSHDMATTDPMAARLGAKAPEQMTRPQNYVGAFGNSSGNQSKEYPNALQGQPILCLNTWQHMYMLDYGILGKRAYLAAWWETIDWDVVYTRYNMDSGVSSISQSTIGLFEGRRRR